MNTKELVQEKIEDKIKFMNDNKYLYDIRTLCRCLDIQHSVYYYHCNHQTNNYKMSNQKLDGKIKMLYDELKGRYFYHKIIKQLNDVGMKVNQKELLKE